MIVLGATRTIIEVRLRLKVVGVDTQPVLAKVIDIEAFGDSAFQPIHFFVFAAIPYAMAAPIRPAAPMIAFPMTAKNAKNTKSLIVIFSYSLGVECAP